MSSGHEQASVSFGQHPGVGGRRAGQLSQDAFQISAVGVQAADVLKITFHTVFTHQNSLKHMGSIMCVHTQHANPF